MYSGSMNYSDSQDLTMAYFWTSYYELYYLKWCTKYIFWSNIVID